MKFSFKKLYIIIIAIMMVIIVAPTSVYAVEDAATQAVRSFLAGGESVYTLTDDITLESDIVVTAGKTIIANDYTITTGEYSIIIRGGALHLSNITQIVGTLKWEYNDLSRVLLLNDDFTDVRGFFIMSHTLYEALVDEEETDILQEGYLVIEEEGENPEVRVILSEDETRIALYDVSARIVQDTTIDDFSITTNDGEYGLKIVGDAIFTSNCDIFTTVAVANNAKYINTGDGAKINRVNLYNNATFVNKGKTDEDDKDVEIRYIEFEDDSSMINEGNIMIWYGFYLAKDATLTNTQNSIIVLLDESDSFDFIGDVNNQGIISLTQTENADYYIGIQKPFTGNQIILNDIELLDVSQRKVLSGETEEYYVEDGFLVYTDKSNVVYLYSERANNVTNISLFSNQFNFYDTYGSYFEMVIQEEPDNKPIKIEVIKANNVLVNDMAAGAVIYNITASDSYILLATEDTDEIDFSTRYLFFEIIDETKQATAQIKYTFADGKTETLNVDLNWCYTFTKGANQTFEPGKSTALSFKLNGPFDKFEALEIYGEEFTVEDGLFVVEEGSTVINFTKAGLDLIETLEEGTYDVYAYYADGMMATTELTIGKIPNPPTGDRINTYILLAGVTLIGMTTLVLIEKKRKAIDKR